MTAFNALHQLANVSWEIPDPGDAGALPTSKSGLVKMTSAAAETRTLGRPTKTGLLLGVILYSDGGTVTLTITGDLGAITFDDEGDFLLLYSVEDTTNLEWVEVTNDGVGGITTEVGGLDLNGEKLDLDADADTSITADTDDQIDIEIAGADDFTFTANSFNVLAGSVVNLADDADLELGDAAGGDCLVRFSTGDADNNVMVIAVDDSSQQLHITDKGAVATDWNVAAATHPELFIHSNTTPATDYLLLGNHDGTTAAVDVVGGTTLDLRIAGTDTAAFTANTWLHSAANSGAVSTLNFVNTSDDASAGAEIKVECGGSSASADAIVRVSELTGHNFTFGVDTSSSVGVIGRGATLGTDDVIRITDASPPVITYNTTHPTGTFDYVCGECGKSGPEPFGCCGKVEWHDDVAALVPALLANRGEMLTHDTPGLKHLERLGVLQLTHSNEGAEEVFMRLDAAQWFTWSALNQVNERLKNVEELLLSN